MPGFAFPQIYSGSLGPWFPTFPARRPYLHTPSVLCSATTTHRPSWVPSLLARPPVPCKLPLWFVSRLSRLTGQAGLSCLAPGLLFSVSTPHLLTYRKETVGSPKFPSCPLQCMPRSQTPVVSCALALSSTALLPSDRWMSSAFPPSASSREVILLTTTIHISRLNSAACTLASPQPRTPVAGFARGVHYQSVG